MTKKESKKLRSLAKRCAKMDEWWVECAGQDMQEILTPEFVLSLLDDKDKAEFIAQKTVALLKDIDSMFSEDDPDAHANDDPHGCLETIGCIVREMIKENQL